MFGPKSLSVYLFYITRLLSFGIVILLLYIIFSFLLGNFELIEGRFTITIPFINSVIKGFYKTNIITTISITLFLYAIFFYLISLVFKTFKAKTPFTKTAIERLNYFAIFNLVGVPIFFVLNHFLIMRHTTYRDLPTYLLHIFLGIFALFVISVFKQGFKVQSENDLTI